MWLVRRARYDRWTAFAVDPGLYYKSFRRHVEVKSHISKDKSFTAVDRVEERLRSLDQPSLTSAQRLALYRAFQTAGLELADRADDSHGNVGQLRRDAWHTYLGIVWQTTGIQAEDYLADLCDLVVFEDYALGFREETLPWEGISADHAELIEGLLLRLFAERQSLYLDHQAEESLQQLAWFAVAGQRFSRYLDIVARLGSDNWMPIEAMAESALQSRQRDLAIEVFRNADRPGFHREHLRQRCLVLTGVDLSDTKQDDRPNLRLVEELRRQPMNEEEIDGAVRRIACRPDLAWAVQAVAHALTAGEGPGLIHQAALQQFLWWYLPRDYPVDEWDGLVEASVMPLDDLGLTCSADVARSEQTASVLAAWRQSRTKGAASFRSAHAKSGVEPPDTALLAWGSVMGVDRGRGPSIPSSARWGMRSPLATSFLELRGGSPKLPPSPNPSWAARSSCRRARLWPAWSPPSGSGPGSMRPASPCIKSGDQRLPTVSCTRSSRLTTRTVPWHRCAGSYTLPHRPVVPS